MPTFAERIRPAVEAELLASRNAEASGQFSESFRRLERAHVLGQASTVLHVRVHTQMLMWAIRHRIGREVVGQLVRIVGAATKTALGWVPVGNTGGSNVSPFLVMPIPDDLQLVMDPARRPDR